MINPFLFTRIPEIHFGPGGMKKLPSLIEKKGKTVLLITGSSSFRKTSHYTILIEELGKRNIVCHESSVIAEPSPQLVDTITRNYRSKRIDVVVAIGGGSVLDAGKAISAMLPLDDSVINYLEGLGTKVHSGLKVPFIAIPTTSGTGSEATKNAVLSQIGDKGYKKSLRHDNFMPDIALVDPELTLSCPADITAACGMDAFTQLIEACTSTTSNPITDAMAYSGIERIGRSLLNVFKNGNDINARNDLSYGSLMSGICLAQAGLGIVHGFASPIGGFFDIPHGVVCGTLMGASTRKNIEKLIQTNDTTAIEKYAQIGKLISNEKHKDTVQYALALANVLDKWVDDLNLPRLSAYGIKESDLEKIISDTSNKNNPVKLSREDMLLILKERL